MRCAIIQSIHIIIFIFMYFYVRIAHENLISIFFQLSNNT